MLLIVGNFGITQAADGTVWQGFIRKAAELRLEEDPHWLKLMHYRGQGEGRRSDVDGGYFFLSPRGKVDSRAELEATLRALLSEEDLSPPMEPGMEGAAMHPLCKFRARLHFFQDRLGLEDSLLPEVDCARYVKWRRALDPKDATLVFASSYLNNPASMFGHTFIRLNTHPAEGSRALLNYGINYAASVPDHEGIRFVYKGVFGKYRGSYSLTPYFFSLQKYSNMESRDLWEYELRLDERQLEYLVEHSWEMGSAWMAYYFFDENCSYDIITLLDALDPAWSLTEGLGKAVVIPSETVKLLSREGLLGKRVFRPSLLTAFERKADALGKGGRKSMRRLIKASPQEARPAAAHPPALAAEWGVDAPPDTLAQVMDAALDYVQYRKRRAEGSDSTRWKNRQSRLLRLRASLPRSKAGAVGDSRKSRQQPPEAGHGSHRGGLGIGASHYRPFTEMEFRFLYHDLNAREDGFLAGSQIEAGKAKLRLTCARSCGEGVEDAELRSADLLNTLSLTPLDLLRMPVSWGFRVGYDTRPAGAHQAGGSATAEGGAGLSGAWNLWEGRVQMLPFALVEAKLRGWYRDGARASAGPQGKVGLRLGLGPSFSLLAWHRQYLPWPRMGRYERDVSVEGRLSLGRNADFRLGALNQDGVGEVSSVLNGYF